AGVVAGTHDEGAAVGQDALAAAGGLLVEHGRSQVPVDGAGVADTVVLDAVLAGTRAKVLHQNPPRPGLGGSWSIVGVKNITKRPILSLVDSWPEVKKVDWAGGRGYNCGALGA